MTRALIAVALLFAGVTGARTQSPPGARWEIGVYGGSAWTSIPSDGNAALPPPGASFTTFGGNPSRRVGSWLFGDGALLLNQLQATRPVPLGRSMVVPLDSLLAASSVRRLNGPSFGVRVSRSFNDRFTLEASVERGTGSLAFTPAVATAVASTRESVERVLRDLLLLQAQPPSTAAEVRDREGKSIAVLGTVKVRLFAWKALAPFASAGGGVLRNTGTAPSLDLQAVYAVRSTLVGLPLVTLTETDRVTIDYSMAKHVPTTAIAGGVDVAFSRRWMWRIEAREQFRTNTLKATLSTTPERTYVNGAPGSFSVSIGTNPAIQIGPIATTPSSLSTPIRDFVIFEGRGVERQFSLNTGLSWRF